MNKFTKRTKKALGSDLVSKFRNNRFCVIGCSGTGANFAEMLVRTGARKIDLVDGSKVKRSGLNRVFAFLKSDCGSKKTAALARRLHMIGPDITVREFSTHFRSREASANQSQDEDVWLAVSTAYAVFIAVDSREDRVSIEKFCEENSRGKYLSCGILVDREKGNFEFECNWKPDSSDPPQSEATEHDGYGPENASFISIVVEAASIAFTMLLSHMKDRDSRFRNYSKRYDGSFQPVEDIIN